VADSGPWEDYAAGPWNDYQQAPKPQPQYGSYDVGPNGERYAVGSPEAIAARSPVAGNNFLQNTQLGIGKLYTDALLGARQIYAQAADAINPRSPTLGSLITGSPTSRYAELQQEALDKRSVDAPLNSTVGGRAGQIVGALPLAFLPGMNSYAGAAAFGGGMGALQPTAPGESRAINTAIGTGVGVASQYVGNQLSNWLTNRAAQPFTGWRQATANNALAESVGAKSLNPADIVARQGEIDAAFSAGRGAQTVDLANQGGSLAQAVSSGAKKLNPTSQAEFANNTAVQDLLTHLRNGTATAQQLGQISSDLSDQAHSIFTTKGADKMVGRALSNVRDEVENLIQGSIADPATAAAYQDARSIYPTWKMMDRSTLFNAAAGNANPRNIGSYLQKQAGKARFLENDSPLYQMARWGQETRMGNAPPVPIFQLGKWLKYQTTNSAALGAIGGTVSRTLAPVSPVLRGGIAGSALITPMLAGSITDQDIQDFFSK